MKEIYLSDYMYKKIYEKMIDEDIPDKDIIEFIMKELALDWESAFDVYDKACEIYFKTDDNFLAFKEQRKKESRL